MFLVAILFAELFNTNFIAAIETNVSILKMSAGKIMICNLNEWEDYSIVLNKMDIIFFQETSSKIFIIKCFLDGSSFV